MERWKLFLLSSLPLVGILAPVFLFDLLFTVSTNPLFLCGVAALGIVVAGGVGLYTRRMMVCLLPVVPFLVVLNFLPHIDYSPVKPFSRFYAAIKPGMTEAEVLQELEEQFPETGRYSQPLVNRRVGPTHLGFILDPKDGRYNAEIVAVDFEEGRVVKKDYHAD